MPKANHVGATYYGYEGHVEDAHGRFSELDPSRNVDGSTVDGFESEDRNIGEQESDSAERAKNSRTSRTPGKNQ